MTGSALFLKSFLALSAVQGGAANAAAPSQAAEGLAPQTLAHQYQSLTAAIDMVWVLVAAALVLMMQIGFMLLEAGSVRTKNAISVAQKNLLDFAFATISFAVLGFGLAFSASSGWLPIGSDGAFFAMSGLSGANASFFIFQVMFCGTAATIISGAVAERMRLRAYVVLCVIMAALIYPIFAHWAWGNALVASSGAFLANAGFVDFAGSTVVHATGGWLALAACLVLGARQGRFTDGIPMRIGGHSAVLASAGALFLFVGWIGFNGGSTLAVSDAVPGIILNTIIAGSAGGVAGYGLMWFGGAMLPERAVNGMVGGLVAVTAGCHLVDPMGALVLGATGGFCANGANYLLEARLRIDDAVGAVGAHGVAGVIGTLGLALLAPAELLPAGSRMDQFLVQAAGSAINFVWAFGAGLVLILAIRPFIVLRVTAEEEAAGLNVAEHGAKLGTDHIQAALESLMQSEPDGPSRLAVESGDDNEDLSTTLNTLMDKLQQAEVERFKEAQAARNEEEAQRLIAFGEVASESIFLIHQGRIHSANASAAALFRTDVERLIGRAPADLVHGDMRAQMAEWLEAGDDSLRKTRILRNDGHEVPVELRFRQIMLDGHQVLVLRMTDLSEREEAQRKIYHLALHDTLTDLPNRELFNRRLDDALAKQHEGYITALLLIDIDHFKDINDLHGHPSGDLLLTAIAERLLSGVRGCDTVARLGGDEFAIIHTNIAFPNQALDLAYRVLNLIGQPLTLPTGTVIMPRASVGIAMYPQDADNAQVLFQNADLALYTAKNQGRNSFFQYRPQMGRSLRLRQELEQDLSQAVSRDELQLLFQPRVSLASGELTSFEALIRWSREGKLVSPDDFIAIAEDSGLIVEIGKWVIENACQAAAQELGKASVSVNVSPRQFQDKHLIETVAQALETSGLEPSRLELEITESVLIDDDQLASRTLAALRELGVRVALDDFGTGYSSLSYLTRFKFDTIKIDRSFVQAEDERTRNVVRSILRMSAELGAAVVAEGVETIEQLERVAAEGCDEVQGFLVSHPVPVAEARKAMLSGIWRAAISRNVA